MVFKSLSRFSKKSPRARELREVQKWHDEEPAERKDDFRVQLDIIKKRRDIRKYQSREISNNLLMDMLDAASHAHSEGNTQPWEFVIVKNPSVKQVIVEGCYGQTWMLSAPVFIVACINMRMAAAMYGERGQKLYGVQGVAAAIENLLLSAESLGLGTCWVGAFSEPKVSIAVHCPEYVRPCAIITIGWPAEYPPAPVIQPLKEIVHLEKFGETILYKELLSDKTKIIR